MNVRRQIAVAAVIGLLAGLLIQPVGAATFNYRLYVLKTFLVPAEESMDEVYTEVFQPWYELERIKSRLHNARTVMNQQGDTSENARFDAIVAQINHVETELVDAHNVLQSVDNTQKAQINVLKRACGCSP